MVVSMLKDTVTAQRLCSPATMVTNYMEMNISHVTMGYGKEKYQSVNVSYTADIHSSNIISEHTVHYFEVLLTSTQTHT